MQCESRGKKKDAALFVLRVSPRSVPFCSSSFPRAPCPTSEPGRSATTRTRCLLSPFATAHVHACTSHVQTLSSQVYKDVVDKQSEELRSPETSGLYLWRNDLQVEAVKTYAKNIAQAKNLKWIWYISLKRGINEPFCSGSLGSVYPTQHLPGSPQDRA